MPQGLLPSKYLYKPDCNTTPRFMEACDWLFQENLGHIKKKICICGLVYYTHYGDTNCCRECEESINAKRCYDESVEMGLIEEESQD